MQRHVYSIRRVYIRRVYTYARAHACTHTHAVLRDGAGGIKTAERLIMTDDLFLGGVADRVELFSATGQTLQMRLSDLRVQRIAIAFCVSFSQVSALCVLCVCEVYFAQFLL